MSLKKTECACMRAWAWTKLDAQELHDRSARYTPKEVQVTEFQGRGKASRTSEAFHATVTSECRQCGCQVCSS